MGMEKQSQAGLKPDIDTKSHWLHSDIGTCVLHWTMVISIIGAMITGFRLSWDGQSLATEMSQYLEPVLLQGDVWLIHFIVSCVVFACASAYAVYIFRASLTKRNAANRIKLLQLANVPTRMKWQSMNILLHWLFYLFIIILMASGVLLYIGFGGLVVNIHSVIALTLVVYFFLHILGHFFQGGFLQLVRIFLPEQLVSHALTKSYPLQVALFSGLIIAIITISVDFQTRPTLSIVKISKEQAPVLDGSLQEEIWKNSALVSVRTIQGIHLDKEQGESLVEIRAVHDENMIYFAFRWQDPTHSLMRLPVIKREDGWHLLHNHADTADESDYYEDKFAIMFSRSDWVSGGVTALGPKPLENKPGPINGRGLHYTSDGSYADVWQWKASRGGHLGKVDDMYFGSPVKANEKEIAGLKRYSAGYQSDPGKSFYLYNYINEPPGGYQGPVQLRRLPKDYAAIQAGMGKINLTPGASVEKGTKWWMFEEETLPYSKNLDAKIPVGTVLPTTLIIGTYEGDRDDVFGAPKWQDGWWQLEVKRKLHSISKYDIDFSDNHTPVYMWVSVFDHNQTRHTRHVQSVELKFEQL